MAKALILFALKGNRGLQVGFFSGEKRESFTAVTSNFSICWTLVTFGSWLQAQHKIKKGIDFATKESIVAYKGFLKLQNRDGKWKFGYP